MKEHYLPTDDSFSEGYQRFQSSAHFKRLQAKFKLKPYFERNAPLRTLTAIISYFLNVFSMATAFFFVYAFLSAIVPTEVAALLALTGLLLLEGLKRFTIPSVFQRYYQFKQVAFPVVAGIIAMTTLSVFLSYKGASDAITALSPKAELIDIPSVRQPVLERISSLEKQKADLSNTSTWKGRYTSSGAKSAQMIDATLAKLDTELIRLTTDAEAANKETLKAHIQATGMKAEYFAGLALIFDLSLIIALAWLEYYDYRSLAEFSRHKAQKQPSAAIKTPTMAQATTFSLNGHSGAERTVIEGFTTAIRNTSDALRHCDNCQASFMPKTVWQRFCCTNCRTDSWERKTGKKLKNKQAVMS
jgi:Zn finger protein HypA/HybF involved in hydrogenase expression